MPNRELVVLGTASQVPTRHRNHNGYLLRWDGEGILFDPGEGTQRQFLFAGVSVSSVTRICVTHFHGDHCLGLPGVIQRLALDQAQHAVDVYFPASGTAYFERLRNASVHDEPAVLRAHPVAGDGVVAEAPPFRIVARRLAHHPETFGWRIEEPGGTRMLPDRLAAAGVHGPDVGRLLELGRLRVGERTVTVDEVSEPRRGQVVAFVLDTGLCDAAFELARDADLLICESTFLAKDTDLARKYNHLTARDAATIAAEARARTLVLTHFSQRYPDEQPFLDEAQEIFHGDLVAATDLLRVPVPARR